MGIPPSANAAAGSSGTPPGVPSPATPPGAPRPAPNPAPAAIRAPGHGRLILVADDEEPIRIISRRTLESFGYRVLVASDGESALKLYQAHGSEIALVITDLEMPGMDGHGMIAALAELNPAVKIVAMSGYLPTSTEGDSGLPPQVVGTLEKPYTAATLLRTLELALVK